MEVIAQAQVSQEEYWAQEVAWAFQKLVDEGETVNWKHIRNMTNMRRDGFEKCKVYLHKYVDEEVVEAICKLI